KNGGWTIFPRDCNKNRLHRGECYLNIWPHFLLFERVWMSGRCKRKSIPKPFGKSTIIQIASQNLRNISLNTLLIRWR
ncbi:MAG: hypothetical protein QW831_02325, partial [Candidatus Jordarchaeaceae archaeon]